MKINIDQVRPEGLHLEEDISAAQLDVDTQEAKLAGVLRVSADVTRVDEVVRVALRLQGALTFLCCRCLEEYQVAIDRTLEHNFPVERSQHTLDITQDIRDDLILEYPFKPLCKTDCKGICPRCGNNRNRGECRCSTKENTN
ncbi:MAG TPA: DUF177 domain-containing protein [Candidatus Omnitrophota bacterium]|nr:DUF177 domain-containing protein [Candidatus Omnitrophota bacterium]HRZ15672.1 DUF177 domain-containing protein [Candidatus Omnitrophota bacterium]